MSHLTVSYFGANYSCFHQIADDAQQAFLSSKYPWLSLVIPALERLHKSWDVRQSKPGYERYEDALSAGLEVIGEYYEKTEDSEAYVLAMGMSLTSNQLSI